MTTWPRQRSVSVVFVAAVIAAGSIAAPCAKAQEVEPQADTTEVGDWFSVLSLGARLVFGDVASPGVSGQLTGVQLGSSWWVSMSFLAQMARWTVQYDPHTRRDYLYLYRYAIGVGTDEGPSAFVFVEGGKGVETSPDSLRGRPYDMFGIGLGVGYTVGRVTATVDLSHGSLSYGAGSPCPNCRPYDLYTLLGVSLQWRVFRR